MTESSTLVSKRPQQNGTGAASHSYGAIDDITTEYPDTPTATGHDDDDGGGEPNGGPSIPSNHQPSHPTMGQRSTLRIVEKIGFGLGHVYNDLCAGVWFSYTLLFMQGALGMPAAEAGALVMLGQVGDAIATPIVGFLTDKYGTKRQWHIAGMFDFVCCATLVTDL